MCTNRLQNSIRLQRKEIAAFLRWAEGSFADSVDRWKRGGSAPWAFALWLTRAAQTFFGYEIPVLVQLVLGDTFVVWFSAINRDGREEGARLKGEHLLREYRLERAMEILVTVCELLISRMVRAQHGLGTLGVPALQAALFVSLLYKSIVWIFVILSNHNGAEKRHFPCAG